nr:MAG TPA: hypothetical protein [Caudoviricetes sp.]
MNAIYIPILFLLVFLNNLVQLLHFKIVEASFFDFEKTYFSYIIYIKTSSVSSIIYSEYN